MLASGARVPLATAVCVLAVLAAVPALAAPARAAALLEITGGGFGPGIGMSQYGAEGYALHGRDYRFILAHYYRGTRIGLTNPGRTVTVLIASGPASFSAATRAGTTKLNSRLVYSATAQGGRWLLLYGPSGKRIGRFAAPLTVTGPGPLEVIGHGLYRGSLELRPSGGGPGVETIDAVDLEDYVRGVVGAEMPAGWAAAALQAQAVAARTYAITTNVGGDGFELYSDTRSQAYRGVAAETPATDAAVAATRGQVVTYGGAPVATYFCASSGGHTESIQNVWLGSTPEPWLEGVPDPYDDSAGNPYYRWSYGMTVASAVARLGSLVHGGLVGIEVTEHGVSPRIVTARVVGTKGSTSVTGPQLQAIFGLPSTYMRFMTISTVAGQAAPRRPPARALMSAANAVLGQFFAPPPALHGAVFPARRGEVVAIALLTRHGWRTVRHVRLRRGGSYRVVLPAPGSYRVFAGGTAGPVVRVD